MVATGQSPPITITLYADHVTPHPFQSETVEWEDVVEMLSEHTFTPCAPCVGKECPLKHGIAFSAVALKQGASRKNDNVLSVSLLALDFDGLTMAELEGVTERLAGFESLLHSTHSHLHNGSDDTRTRIVLLPSRVMTPDEYRFVRSAVCRRFQLHWKRPTGETVGADESAKDLSRLFFLPTAPEGSEVIFGREHGAMLDVDELLRSAPQALQVPSGGAIPVPPSMQVPFVGVGGSDMDVLRQVLRGYKPRNEDEDAGVIPKRELVRRVVAGEALVRVDEPGQREKSCHRLGKILAHLLPLEIDDEIIAELVRPSIMSMPTYADDGPDDALDMRFGKLDYSLRRGRADRRQKDVEKAAERARASVLHEKMHARFKLNGSTAPTQAAAATAPGEPEPDPEDSSGWEERLKCKLVKGENVLHNFVANAITILAFHPEWQDKLRYNELTKNVDIVGDCPLNTDSEKRPEQIITSVKVWLQNRYNLDLSTADVRDAILQVSKYIAYNPLQDYLNGCAVDGVPRADSFLEDYCGVSTRAPDEADITEHVRKVSRRWLLSCVARALEPGCKMDTVLIFEGKTGIYKSSALKALGGQFFSDSKIIIGTNEAMMAAGRNWLHELSELTAFKASETEQQKAFFSSATDQFRPPYEPTLREFPRMCVFVGSTNEDRYLNDITGNRRYWPVDCKYMFNIKAIRRDRDLIWAEAVAIYKAGLTCEACLTEGERCSEHRWWFTEKENEELEKVNKHRLKGDFSEGIVGYLLRLPPERRKTKYTVFEVATELLNIPSDRINYQQVPIARSLKALGFEKSREMLGGIRQVFHHVPEALLRAPQQGPGVGAAGQLHVVPGGRA